MLTLDGLVPAGRSGHPDLSGGAALQVTLAQLEMDFYPYHLAAGDRGHWVKYSVDCGPAVWAHAALAQFRTLLTDTLNSSRSSHTPLARAPPHTRHDTPPHQRGGCAFTESLAPICKLWGDDICVQMCAAAASGGERLVGARPPR
ncbi:hypothetical protein GWK47_003088 [Chionoecetes opilio]|uniref:Uncharacterized protein n=1 Tax=Chionoecetes opilio TaxID=41210 RepID=A0A8J8WDF2_CHIOP|nr:hypothetical protein GWK47_003088 [Chionoecetes opilio]